MDFNYSKFRVKPDSKVNLKDFATSENGGFDKKSAGDEIKNNIKQLKELQEMFYADDRYSLLIILQARDAAGKDGVIRHVMSGINPQGCRVHSFKTPTTNELEHDYMWRHYRALPERGMIEIFNRSHYENVLNVFPDTARLMRSISSFGKTVTRPLTLLKSIGTITACVF